MILLDADYTAIFVFFIGILLAPPIILTIVGLSMLKTKPKTAKILFILAGVYILVGLGICGSMMA